MKILGLDFETQGLNTKTDLPTEVGAVMVEVEVPFEFDVFDKTFNQLIWGPNHVPQSKEVVEVTGITDTMLKVDGVPEDRVLHQLIALVEEADYVLAHNKKFDEAVFKAMCERNSTPVPRTPWLCSLSDIEYDPKFKCKKLAHLAYDHGIIVHPDTLHRAEQDVKLMLRLVLEKYDINQIIEYAQTPWIFLRAFVPAPWNDNKEGTNWAKANGFGWEGAPGTDEPRFDKWWIKRTKEKHFLRETTDKPYQVVRVGTS